MSIEIGVISKSETAYSKEIIFFYEGESYQVNLYWNNQDGYDIDFVGQEPEWAINWEDSNDESLAYTLDTLTDEILEIGRE
jgi:hypothetical protein